MVLGRGGELPGEGGLARRETAVAGGPLGASGGACLVAVGPEARHEAGEGEAARLAHDWMRA